MKLIPAITCLGEREREPKIKRGKRENERKKESEKAREAAIEALIKAMPSSASLGQTWHPIHLCR